MDIATRSADMSFAIRRKVGAVLVKDFRILSTGFNGTPKNTPNVCEFIDNTGNLVTLDNVIHAEKNAIEFAKTINIDLSKTTIYCTLSPCVQCAKLILESGISTVVYRDTYRTVDGLNILSRNGVELINMLYMQKETYENSDTQTSHNPKTRGWI